MPPSEEQLRCRDIILSQDYADFIVAYGGNVDVTVGVYEPSCYEIVNSNFLIMHKPLPEFSDTENRCSRTDRFCCRYSIRCTFWKTLM